MHVIYCAKGPVDHVIRTVAPDQGVSGNCGLSALRLARPASMDHEDGDSLEVVQLFTAF